MAESVINSPNSATGNALGLSLHHNMDCLLNDSAIPLDAASPYGMYNFDMGAKSYPFQLNQFSSYPSSNYYEPTYSSDDIHKFQVQLYQELRYQVARQDLQKDMTFSSGYHEVDSMSGTSTIDTPVLNTSVISIPDTVLSTDYMVPLPEASTPKKRRAESCPKVGMGELKVQKRTRKQIMARSRSGCWICRIKHLKCDEHRPVCQNCTRFGIQCDYSPERPDYVSDKELRRQKLDTINTKKRRTTTTTTTIQPSRP